MAVSVLPESSHFWRTTERPVLASFFQRILCESHGYISAQTRLWIPMCQNAFAMLLGLATIFGLWIRNYKGSAAITISSKNKFLCFSRVGNLNFEYWNFDAVVTVFVLKCMKIKVFVTQSCLTLYNPIDCSPPGSSVHGNLQARILVWVAISFSRGSSQPRDQTQVSCIAGRYFMVWVTKEAHLKMYNTL